MLVITRSWVVVCVVFIWPTRIQSTDCHHTPHSVSLAYKPLGGRALGELVEFIGPLNWILVVRAWAERKGVKT